MNLGKIREAHFRYGPTRDFYPLREILILIIITIIMIIKIIEQVITVIVAIKIKVLLLIIVIEVVIQITFYSLKLLKTTMMCK